MVPLASVGIAPLRMTARLLVRAIFCCSSNIYRLSVLKLSEPIENGVFDGSSLITEPVPNTVPPVMEAEMMAPCAALPTAMPAITTASAAARGKPRICMNRPSVPNSALVTGHHCGNIKDIWRSRDSLALSYFGAVGGDDGAGTPGWGHA